MKRKRVLLDCDGVIADFVSSYLALLNEEGNTNYVHTDITDWDIVGCLNIPQDVQDRANARVTYDFCRNLDPLPGAIEGVRALQEVADVYIVTSPWVGCRGWSEARYEWLLEHCGIKSGRVMHGSGKEICKGDIFVDDKTSTVEMWAKEYPTSMSILWAQPWNRKSAHPYRTRDWRAIRDFALYAA